ncbi:MAG: hypothetical protein ABIY35_09275 [Chitinophagaceae bacterium]
MRILLATLFTLTLFYSCKNDTISLSGDAQVSMDEFSKAFQPLKLPIRIYDTSLQNAGDTTTISYAAISGIVPDSVMQSFKRGKDKSPKITFHAIGKKESTTDNFYLLTIRNGKNTGLIVFVFDKEKKFVAYQDLLEKNNPDDYSHNVFITAEPAFIISREKKGKENTILYSRNSLAYSASALSFITVMKDSNENPENIAVINPLDTLPQKHTYSGNYIEDKRNYISLRDGKDENNYQFFIHFEKNDGDCIGELKGIMKMTDSKHAIFQENGDVCVIDFQFEGKRIIVKERGNCGNHRGIKCFFDDEYVKKKPN